MTVTNDLDIRRLERLANALGAVDLSLDVSASQARDQTVNLIEDFLLPRSRSPHLRRVVAIVGASGTGKSTIFNSLAGRRLADAGARRPTTIEPTVWSGTRTPGTLAGLRRSVPGRIAQTVRKPPEHMALVDTPPPDVPGDVGLRILDVADACLLVVSATRYADATGFDLVERASRRGIPIAVVLNRLPPGTAADDLIRDLVAKLGAAGREIPVFAVEESAPVNDVLEYSQVAAIWDAIASWGQDDQTREAATTSAFSSVRSSAAEVRRALDDISSLRSSLAGSVDEIYREQTDALMAEVAAGRFAEFGEDEVRDALAAALVGYARRAAAASASEWEISVPHLLAANPELRDVDESTPDQARARVEAWASGVDVGPAMGKKMRSVWRRFALDPSPPVSRSERKMVESNPRLPELPRAALVVTADRLMASDAARFHQLLGTEPPEEVLRELRLDDDA